jgi:tetratricopeptide (TPR) repeat protein
MGGTRSATLEPRAAPGLRAAWLLAVPLLLAAAAYARVLDGEFQLDDLRAVPVGPAAADLAAALRRLPGALVHGGRPVADLTFALDRAAGGAAPRAYHATNLAIHLGAVVLAYAFTRKVLRLAGAAAGTWTALAVAGLFALHPLQSQAVSYVVQRSEALASGLYLLALLFLLDAERPGRGWRSAGGLAGGLAAFALALGAKVVAVTLPAAWLLLAWMVPGEEGRKDLASWPRRLALMAPVVAVAVVIGLGALRGLRGQASAGFDVPGLSPTSYFLSQWKVVATYLRLLAWPSGQNLEWDVPVARSLADPGVAASGAALAALLVGAAALFAWSRRRQGAGAAAGRVASFGVAWFFLLLAPTSSVVPLDDLLMEHRVYLASWGILAAACAGGERLLARLRWRPAAAAALVVALWGTLALALHRRNAAWETRLAMATDSVAKSPGKPRVHVNLGQALAERGDLDAAIREYRLALALAGDAPHNEAMILRNLSAALASQGRWDEAEAALWRAVERDPGNADVITNLAIALARKGDLDGAEGWASRALALWPDEGQALHLLGIVRLRRGDAPDALDPLERAVRADPEDGLRRFNLAVAQERLGRLAEACASWRNVARLRAEPRVRAEAERRLAAAGCPAAPPR